MTSFASTIWQQAVWSQCKHALQKNASCVCVCVCTCMCIKCATSGGKNVVPDCEVESVCSGICNVTCVWCSEVLPSVRGGELGVGALRFKRDFKQS